jgi:hypothetical protein
MAGVFQGSLYAIGMIMMTQKAQISQSARPYSYFQAAMSGGRMIGPWIIGLGSLISLYGGMWFLFIYDLIVSVLLIKTILNTKLNDSKPL